MGQQTECRLAILFICGLYLFNFNFHIIEHLMIRTNLNRLNYLNAISIILALYSLFIWNITGFNIIAFGLQIRKTSIKINYFRVLNCEVLFLILFWILHRT